MHLSDRTTGLAFVGLGVFAWFGASRLPPMAGQAIGPSVFPTVIGAGLCLCGILIALGIGRTFEENAATDLTTDPAEAPTPSSWIGLRALVPVAALAFYVQAVDGLGFVSTAAVMVFGVATALGAGLRFAVPLALAAPVVIHLIFSKLLRVPLPTGLLQLPW